MQKFTNKAIHSATIDTVIYSCPVDSYSTIHNLLITNNENTAVTLNLKLKKIIGADEFEYHCVPSDFELRAKTTLEMKPINMIAGDRLTIKSTSPLDVIASILEESVGF